MGTIAATSKTLIARVKSGDPIAWEEFYHTYKRLIFVIAKSYGLSDADTADLIQNVMLDLWKPGKFRFEPSTQARFRTWFSRIVKNKLIDRIRERNSCVLGSSSEHLDVGQDPAESSHNLQRQLIADAETRFEEEFDSAWKRALLEEALQCLQAEVEPLTYRAFVLCNIDGVKPAQVAQCLGMTENNVYQITIRCRRRLSEMIREMDENPLNGGPPSPKPVNQGKANYRAAHRH